MKNRIKEVRLKNGLSQDEFASKLKLSRNYIWMIEAGERVPSDRTISDICKLFGYNEDWLRNGKGDMHASKTRSEELDEFVDSVLHDRPDSFRSALVDTLVRFKPEEWELLEKIFDSIQEKREKKTDD